jgi:hypothetical protein
MNRTKRIGGKQEMSKHKYDTKGNLGDEELTGRGITRALVRVKKKKEKADIRIGRIVQPMHTNP